MMMNRGEPGGDPVSFGTELARIELLGTNAEKYFVKKADLVASNV
jgi:hypothetical protein